MPSNLEGRYIRLQVVGGYDLQVPSKRIPAGIYVSIDVNSTQCWRSAIGVLAPDKSIVWNDTQAVTLSTHESPKLSLELRASFEVDRMLGNGEVIGQLETPWKDLFDSGDEPLDISFPPVRDVHPSLTLKATVVHVSDNQDDVLFDSIVECQIARHADAGHSRFATYVTSEAVSHLVDAVEHFQLVLDRCPVGHLDRVAALTNVAYSRLEGYRLKNLQDIESTTALFREALTLCPQGHPGYFLSLYHFTKALTYCHNKNNTAADIHESAQAVGADDVDHAIRQCNQLPTDASNEGIHLRRMVLELCPLGNEHRPEALDKLACVLRTRFQQYSSIDDIDECIQCGREALSLCPGGHPEYGSYLNDLGLSLYYRFNYQGRPGDIHEAVSLYEEALHLCPVGHQYRGVSLRNLGVALLTRFSQRGDVNDINEAVSLQREVLTLCPPGHLDRHFALNNLADALQTRYDKIDISDDLNEAIDCLRESLQLNPHGHPERHRSWCSLSSALCSRFMQTQEDEDVEEAIRLCQESLEALPSLHPDRYFGYRFLQEAYLSRYRVQHKSADMLLAVENFKLASRHPTQDFPNRIVTAQNWVTAAEQHNHPSTLEAYNTYFDLLDGHLATRSSIISRREAAAAFSDARLLPVDAVSCAIRHDNLRYAVELVEQARGQQWSLASRLRSPLEDLEPTNPNLAHKFSEISKRLSDAQSSAVITDRAVADRVRAQYRRLTEKWRGVVDEIRNLRGFSRFLLPLSYEDLQVAARFGPVIILIASHYSCSAIIVPTSGEPRHVSFPRINLTHLEVLKKDFAREIRYASYMRPEETRKALQGLLQTVWDEIMLPIVIVLQRDLRVGSRSRIWLCPTATFTSIPLHAAHPFRMKADGHTRELCLEDVYICSYTPTLSALIRSRQMMKTRVTSSFAAIGRSEPDAGQREAFRAIDSELELVRKIVPATANFTTLFGDFATRAGALDALQRNTWVHLACRGKQDHEQPYYSCFAMRDEPLTLLDIMKQDIPHAEFAFLSGSHTAVGDEKTPDEVIHLAAGLQFSGFKSVIGTLGVVDNAVAKHIVEAFYKFMFDPKYGGVMDCTKAAWALNCATHVVKTKVPLEQRIVFIHIGV